MLPRANPDAAQVPSPRAAPPAVRPARVRQLRIGRRRLRRRSAGYSSPGYGRARPAGPGTGPPRRRSRARHVRPTSCERSETPLLRGERGGFRIISTPRPIGRGPTPWAGPRSPPRACRCQPGSGRQPPPGEGRRGPPGPRRPRSTRVPGGETTVRRTAPVHSSVSRSQLARPASRPGARRHPSARPVRPGGGRSCRGGRPAGAGPRPARRSQRWRVAGRGAVPHAAELDAEQLGSPPGVLASEVQGRVVDGLPLRRPCRRPGAVGGGDHGVIARTEAGDEGPDGTHREVELLGDAGRESPIAPSVQSARRMGRGDTARHGSAPAGVVIESHEHHHNPLRAPAGPTVAISGENPRRNKLQPDFPHISPALSLNYP